MRLNKKITSALTAVAMSAVLVSGMAVSASAATVYDTNEQSIINATYQSDGVTPITGGGFYAATRDLDGDGTVGSAGDFVAAPYGMYDGNIAGGTVNGVTYDHLVEYDGTEVTFSLQTATYKFTTPAGVSYEVEGTITDIRDSNDENANSVIENGRVSMEVGVTYYLVTSSGGHENNMPVRFIIDAPDAE